MQCYDVVVYVGDVAVYMREYTLELMVETIIELPEKRCL
jgi:hypothetical protein